VPASIVAGVTVNHRLIRATASRAVSAGVQVVGLEQHHRARRELQRDAGGVGQLAVGDARAVEHAGRAEIAGGQAVEHGAVVDLRRPLARRVEEHVVRAGGVVVLEPRDLELAVRQHEVPARVLLLAGLDVDGGDQLEAFAVGRCRKLGVGWNRRDRRVVGTAGQKQEDRDLVQVFHKVVHLY
jgi:hypothetical protein